MVSSDKSFEAVKKRLEENKKALEKTKGLLGELQTKEKKARQVNSKTKN